MRLFMHVKWVYSQGSTLKQLEIDPALQNGICMAMTYEWLKRELAGLSTTPDVIDQSVFRMASMQRAGVGRPGQVAEVVKMLEGGQSQSKTQRHLDRLEYAWSVENIARLAARDGLIAEPETEDLFGLGDFLRETPAGGMTNISGEDEAMLLPVVAEFDTDVRQSGQTLAIYISLRRAAGGHAVGLTMSTAGSRFFDPNYGEYYSPSPFEGLLWVLCSHVPARYGARYDKTMMTMLKGRPRDAAFLAKV